MRVIETKLWVISVVVLLIITVSASFLQPVLAQNNSGWIRSEFKEIHGNFSPLVDQEGSVYVGTKDGYMYCFDSYGEMRWKKHYELEDEDITFVGGTLGEDGYLYFSGITGVIKLDTDGIVQWKHPVRTIRKYYEKGLRDYWKHPPVVTSDGDVFVMTYTIWKVNEDGAQRFGQWEGDHHPLEVDDGGYVYVIIPERGIYALDPQGEVIWGTRINNIRYQPVIRDDGTIHVTADNVIYAIDSTDGDILWNITLKSNANRKPLIHNDEIIVADMSNTVYKIEAINGTILDSFTTSDYIWSWSLGKNDTIYWSSTNTVTAIDMEGNVKWDYDIRGHLKWWTGSLIDKYYITGEPVEFGNRVYLLTNKFDLYALEGDPEVDQELHALIFNIGVATVFICTLIMLAKFWERNEISSRRCVYTFFYMISGFFTSMYFYLFFIGFFDLSIFSLLILFYFMRAK